MIYPPRIYPPAFPLKDQPIVDSAGFNLGMALSIYGKFRSSIDLYSFLKSIDVEERAKPFELRRDIYPFKLNSWMENAAMSGVVSLYNYKKNLNTLIDQCKACESLSDLVDMDSLRKSNSLFDKFFPNYGPLRTGVAHVGEIFATPEKRAKNSYSGTIKDGQQPIMELGENTVVAGSLVNDAYTLTFNGRIHQMSMTEETADNLLTSLSVLFSSFQKVEEVGARHFQAITERP